MRHSFALLLASMAVPALAQSSGPVQPAEQPRVQGPAPMAARGLENDLPIPAPPSQTPRVVPFGQQVYQALERPQGDVPFSFLRDAVNSLGGICTSVTEFQKQSSQPAVLTHKVKCASRPLYVLTVDRGGKMLIGGGDGSVPPMRPADGQIVTEAGAVAAAAPGAAANARFGRVNDQIPLEAVKRDPLANRKDGIIQPGDPRAWARWLLIGIFAAGVLIAVLMYNRYKHYGRYVPSASAPLRFPSEVKDQMIEESREVHPDYWLHPTGIIIIRGRHGKRRVFDSKFYAMLYYRWGFKFRQLR